MAFMAQPWRNKSGTYYIRRRIPKDLLQVLPEYGEFYKRTLSTKSPTEAKTRFVVAWVESEELFTKARLQAQGQFQPTLGDAIQLAHRWAQRELLSLDQYGGYEGFLVDIGGVYDTVGEHYGVKQAKAYLQGGSVSKSLVAILNRWIDQELTLQRFPPVPHDSAFREKLQEAFLAKLRELSAVAYQRLHQDDYTTGLSSVPDTALSTDVLLKPVAPTNLSKVFEGWVNRVTHTDGDTRDVLKRVGEYRATINRFIEFFGDMPIDQIRRKTIEEFHGLLRRLPSKGEGIRALNVHEQITKADALGLPRLSSVTVKNRLMALSSVMSYAVLMEYISENPVTTSGITKQLAKANSKTARTAARKSYTRAELVRIFSSPLYCGEWKAPRASFGEAWYWMPLLLCYTGARREEIAQLRAGEVKKSEEGVWFLDLLSTPEEGGSDHRTLKTLGSHRVVALHPDLIELGLVGYVASLPSSGQLFPYLKPNPGGWYGHNFGKRWSEYLRKVVGLDTTVSPSHGFRHAFKTMCRETGIPEEIHDAITGHDNGSVSRKYGERQLLSVQAEYLSKMPSIAKSAGLLRG
jgi:integrase